MQKKLFKLSAILLIISGILNLITEIFSIAGIQGTVFLKLLNFFGAMVAIWGMLGLYLKKSNILGNLGLISFAMYSIGLVSVTSFLFTDALVFTSLDVAKVTELTNGTTGVGIFSSIILYVLGLIFFGVYSAGFKKVYPRSAMLIFSIGSLVSVFGLVLPTLVVSLVESLSSFCIIYLGYWLWKIESRVEVVDS